MSLDTKFNNGLLSCDMSKVLYEDKFYIFDTPGLKNYPLLSLISMTYFVHT